MLGVSNWQDAIRSLFPVLVSGLIWRWDSTTTCSYPTYLWLPVLYVSMIALIGFASIADSLKSLSAARVSIIAQTGLLLPYKVSLTLLGLFWQIGNMQQASGGYSLPMGVDWLMFFWLGVSASFDYHFALSTYISVKLYQARLLLNEITATADSVLNNPILLDLTLRFQEQSENSTGLTESEMDKIQKLKFDDTASNNQLCTRQHRLCAICTETLGVSQVIFKLPRCEHLYHEGCITPWLLAKPLCPLCRANVRKNMNLNALAPVQ